MVLVGDTQGLAVRGFDVLSILDECLFIWRSRAGQQPDVLEKRAVHPTTYNIGDIGLVQYSRLELGR